MLYNLIRKNDDCRVLYGLDPIKEEELLTINKQVEKYGLVLSVGCDYRYFGDGSYDPEVYYTILNNKRYNMLVRLNPSKENLDEMVVSRDIILIDDNGVIIKALRISCVDYGENYNVSEISFNLDEISKNINFKDIQERLTEYKSKIAKLQQEFYDLIAIDNTLKDLKSF